MPDDITIGALQTLSNLKRQGVIPTIRPCCGHDHCICPDAPQPESLRDYAPDVEAFDRMLDTIQPLRLRVVTMGTGNQQPCDGSMTCRCERCIGERADIAPKGAGPAQFKVRPARRAA